MKIRYGFVSNSSSQSFVVRGIKIKKADMCELFKVKNFYDVRYIEAVERCGITVKDTKYYFDGEETDDCIVGVELCELNDGKFEELPEATKDTDTDIQNKLLSVGFVDVKNLRTYIQYVSNDNY